MFCKNRGGGVKASLVSGNYYENKVSVVMEIGSIFIKIRHVFADTSLTERSIGAGPPVIIQLSRNDQHGGHLFKWGATAGILLASILLKEMHYLVYIRYLWL